MTLQLQSLVKTNTWILVSPSSIYNLIGCKWMCKIKLNPDRSIERRKAQLVAKGFYQQLDIDNTETFSLVVKPITIRLVFSLAISHCWSLRQIDIQNAFLHEPLCETIFMEQPPRFMDPLRPHFVYKLNKVIYGLKQTPRA